MRVDRTDTSSVQNTETSGAKKTDKAAHAKGKKTEKPGAPAAAKHTEAVKSDISTAGKDFAKAHSVASHAPDTREDKIAELKRRIAAGKYEVDADAVADRMVDEHLQTNLS
jgi:negative regulator of flagellin synthesis FlgM